MQRQAQQLAGVLILAEKTKRPPFLVRNIEQRIICDKDRRTKPKVARLDREKFDLRSAAYLTEMNERLSPKLKVSVTGIAPAGRRGQSENVVQTAVRARGHVISARCRLRIFLFSISDPTICLFQTHRIISLQGEKQADGKYRLSIDLWPGEKPFEVLMDQLTEIVDTGTTWRESLAENYMMRFHITFAWKEDEKGTWEALELPTTADPKKGLWAKWGQLPRCPSSSEPLAVFVDENTTTKYVLNVKMRWGMEEWLPRTHSKRQGTPLETANALKRQKHNTQLLTPASTPARSVASTASTNILVRYHLPGKMTERNSYQCVLSDCRPRNFVSLEKLELHLANQHPSLHFTIDTESYEAIDESVVDIRIHNTNLDGGSRRGKGRGRQTLEKSDSVIEDFGFSSPAPSQSSISVTEALHNVKWRIGGRFAKAKEAPPVVPPPIPAFGSVADIRLDLPERVRQRRPVASHPKKAQNITFLSSDNKTALTEGEVLSDEDDGTDETHLDMARRMQMTEHVTDPVAKKFLLDINAHIESEGLSGDKYLGPSLRRWLHKRPEWLQDTAIAKMFEDLASAALKKEYMSCEVYDACMDILKDNRVADTARNSSGQRMPGHVEPPKRTKDVCSCGKGFISVRDRIACSNKACSFPDHHKSCILKSPAFAGKAALPSSLWYCTTCIEVVRKRMNWSGAVPPGIIRLGGLHSPEDFTEDWWSSTLNERDENEFWSKVLQEHGCRGVTIDDPRATMSLKR